VDPLSAPVALSSVHVPPVEGVPPNCANRSNAPELRHQLSVALLPAFATGDTLTHKAEDAFGQGAIPATVYV
jgi:hypothetical protein